MSVGRASGTRGALIAKNGFCAKSLSVTELVVIHITECDIGKDGEGGDRCESGHGRKTGQLLLQVRGRKMMFLIN